MGQAAEGRGLGQMTLIALGGNATSHDMLPQNMLASAINVLKAELANPLVASPIYRTPAFPPGAGADYANAVIRTDADRPPEALLALLHDIEARFGRVRQARWASRTLDLDLLAVGDLVLPDAATQRRWQALDPARQAREAPPTLILPHPRLQDRPFVLVPMADVAPGWRHPLNGTTVAEMCAALPPADRAAVRPWD